MESRNDFQTTGMTLIEGIVGGLIHTGSAFLHLPNKQQAFIPAKLIHGTNIGIGDQLRCWCVPNSSEHWDRVQYRVIRLAFFRSLTGREIDFENMPVAMPPAPPPPPAPLPPTQSPPVEALKPLSRDDIERLAMSIMAAHSAFTAKDIHREICSREPARWGEDTLLGRVTSTLITMASEGSVASANIYSNTTQTHASGVYYAGSLHLLESLLGKS